jgi:hypothetical protein
VAAGRTAPAAAPPGTDGTDGTDGTHGTHGTDADGDGGGPK